MRPPGALRSLEDKSLARNELHYQIKTFGRVVVKIVVDGGNRRMFKFREQQRFAFEVSDRLFVLGVVDVRLDHFLDGAQRLAEVRSFAK